MFGDEPYNSVREHIHNMRYITDFFGDTQVYNYIVEACKTLIIQLYSVPFCAYPVL